MNVLSLMRKQPVVKSNVELENADWVQYLQEIAPIWARMRKHSLICHEHNCSLIFSIQSAMWECGMCNDCNEVTKEFKGF